MAPAKPPAPTSTCEFRPLIVVTLRREEGAEITSFTMPHWRSRLAKASRTPGLWSLKGPVLMTAVLAIASTDRQESTRPVQRRHDRD